jgi:hypothetical protein
LSKAFAPTQQQKKHVLMSLVSVSKAMTSEWNLALKTRQQENRIPHFAFTMPANLKAVKRWIARENIGGPFTTIYRGASQDLPEIRLATKNSARALRHGKAVKPAVEYEPLSQQAIGEAVANPNSLVHHNQPGGPLNPKRSELLCDGSLLRRVNLKISGLRYSLLYI